MRFTRRSVLNAGGIIVTRSAVLSRTNETTPTWWLKQGEEPGEALGLTIMVKAAFPLEWGKEYYTVDSTVKQVRATCVGCNNTGKVTIKGTEYDCPRCRGNWRDKEIVGQKTVYSVAKWALTSITVTPHGMEACFERLNGKTTGG